MRPADDRCEEFIYGDGKGGMQCDRRVRWLAVRRDGLTRRVCGIHRGVLLRGGWAVTPT